MSISHFLQYKLTFTALLLFLYLLDFFEIQANAESKVHIVYMGRRQHDDVELVTSAHHQILNSVLESQEAARDSIIYSYKHGFSGFAARLTKSQAKKIAEFPDVIHVVPNHLFKLHTTRSWDYLGLSESSPTTNLLHEANRGDGIIIGVLDTGIWPESEAFNDKGLGPIPSRWKGHCQSGTEFDPAKACNRKLIGAKYFLKGFEAEAGRPAIKDPDFLKVEFASPRDRNGHGTHTSSTAGGSFAPNASYHGLGYGTVRGGAPKARIAMYKVCWNWLIGGCTFADLMMAIDEAIHDGVDILSISLGMITPQYADVDMRSGVAFASFHAVIKGITVVCSGGNEGPIPQTIEDTSPWILTVAASSIDRSFPTLITLGNNRTFAGQSLYTGKETGFISIAHPENSELENTRFCNDLNTNDTWAAGKVVLCFLIQGDELDLTFTQQVVQEVGGLGLIVAKNPTRALYYFTYDFPSIGVSIDVGAQLLNYIRYSRKPQVKLSPSRTHVGKPVSTHIASFSSRGPNSIAPAILKPDIAAPGVNILAAVPPEETPYEFESGTSMAAPHVSGIVALLKSLHPHWSPAAIKSALVTTAWQTDPHSGEPVIAEGNPNKIADPFDFGGGLVNANGAKDPGLVYDVGTFDYILYLCSMAYNNSAISMLIDQAASCPINRPSILDLNLPSVTIPSIKKTVTVRRTVTNVGPVNSKYKAIIEPPLGITIKVKPETLIFNSSTKKISFTLTISTTHKYTTDYYFGSLTWTDEVHRVHIVYMGRRRHDDVELTTSAHHQILTSVLGSKEAARDSIIYSYKHGFSGFAAKLTISQAKKIAELPDVVHVIPNHLYKLHTTRSWDYLGMSTSSPPTNLLHEANMGDGVIIGVLDTGIWPESEAFNDKGLGPIPSKWKGHCQSGTKFDPAKACNRKLIGAKYFLKGLEAELGRPIIKDPSFVTNEFASPRDSNGHGTHTSSTAGGSFVPNASYHGLAYGTVRGGAPKARIAMYKVCWSSGVCQSADIIKGIDEAIHDGVDVLSISIGLSTPQYTDVDMRNGIAFASYHAVDKGITVVCSGGNEGPIPQTVDDTSPWIITVAASSIDRSFPTLITLSNNRTFVGQSLYTGKETDFINIVYPERKLYCDNLNTNDTWAAGKVVLCFLVKGDEFLLSRTRQVVKEVGSLGLIAAKNPTRTLYYFASDFPSVGVSIDVGAQLLDYIRYSRKPQVKLSASKTHVGKPVSTHIASFSSRGPNSVSPAILKPDIAAPGVNILAAVPPEEIPYKFDSGTSMAAPHISGIVALLKSLHPHWSPAAIKSALVTTAWQTDPHSGEPIIAEGNPNKIADPFDFGGGLVNANRAKDPGLVYDMGESDYVFNYLCPMGYNTSAISSIINGYVTCANNMPSILDFNLPSLTIPSLKKTVTVRRTVTNVGPVNSKYKAIIEPPLGITIKVKPETLIFNSSTEKISFSLIISTSHKYTTGYYFGSLTWTDEVHRVRSPISVRTEFPEHEVC